MADAVPERAEDHSQDANGGASDCGRTGRGQPTDKEPSCGRNETSRSHAPSVPGEEQEMHGPE